MILKKYIFALLAACVFSLPVFAEGEINSEGYSSESTIASGTSIYVSPNSNVWLRNCPSRSCKVIGSKHVGDRLSFVKYSEDRRFILIDDGRAQSWMQAGDLQFEPTGKALVEKLNNQIEQLKTDLGEAPQIAENYKKANVRLEKLEKENQKLKDDLAASNKKLEQFDIERREYAEKIEAQEFELQMRWWIQGAVIAGCGALCGIILVYMPRPNSKRKRDRF